jgi:DNA-binding CsgD family transcriptional regulator
MESTHINGDRTTSLTPREEEVLEHLSVGKTNAQIAAALHVSVHAVKFHLQQVFRKFGVVNRTEAAVRYANETRSHGSS